MNKIKEYKVIIIIILIILGFAFYWFELRPTQIRKECSKGFSSLRYEKCLQEHGLNK